MASKSKLCGVDPKVIFGKNVHRIRNQKGLTQEKLAERAEIDRRYLQRIEVGSANPGIKVIARFPAALNCRWSDLFRGL